MKRIDYIDTAKGIAIILVVLQHASITISNYIMSFHMPFFFFIYGFALSDIHLNSLYTPKRGIKTYIVPYFIWAFIYLRRFNIQSYLQILWGTSSALRPISQAILWFLPVFFLSSIIYRIIMQKILASEYNKYLLCLLGILFFSIFDRNINYYNLFKNGMWFGCNIVGGGIMFMILGYLFRKIFTRITEIRTIYFRYLVLMIIIAIGVLLIPTYKLNAPVIMGIGYYGKYYLYLLTAISQSILLICLSYLVRNKVIQYLGRNTMIIYLIHPIFLSMYKELGMDFYSTNANAVASSILAISMALLIAQVINHNCPWLIGKINVN